MGSSESLETSKSLFTVIDPKQRISANPVAWAELMAHRLSPALIPPETTRLPEKPNKRTVGVAEIHQRLLAKEYGPPSVIVNERSKVVHVFGGRAAIPNLARRTDAEHSDMAPPVMRLELRTALYQIFQKEGADSPRRTRQVRIGVNGHELAGQLGDRAHSGERNWARLRPSDL